MGIIYLYKPENSFEMGDLEKRFKETLESASKGFKNDPVLEEYIQASKNFNKLVEKGVAVKRGHNLRSPGEMHLAPESFNTKSL